ncbi:MAG: hypothetical protein JWR34_188 [Mycobacterium sp.]|nr:hypothetical protein [Mycobacterium sp.]
MISVSCWMRSRLPESAKDEAAKVVPEAQIEASKILESAKKTVGTPNGDGKSK